MEYDAERAVLENLIEPDNSGSLAQRTEFWETVKDSLAGINRGFEIVFEKNFYGKTLKEIGFTLGISKQRTGQIYLRSVSHLESKKSRFLDFKE